MTARRAVWSSVLMRAGLLMALSQCDAKRLRKGWEAVCGAFDVLPGAESADFRRHRRRRIGSRQTLARPGRPDRHPTPKNNAGHDVAVARHARSAAHGGARHRDLLVCAVVFVVVFVVLCFAVVWCGFCF